MSVTGDYWWIAMSFIVNMKRYLALKCLKLTYPMGMGVICIYLTFALSDS